MYNQEFEMTDDTFYVRLSGEFPSDLLNSLPNAFIPLIEKCRELNCKKILINALKLKVNLRTFELFNVGEDMTALTGLVNRIAFVISKEYVNPFFEDVTSNRGVPLRVFTEEKEARIWLNRV